MSLIGSVIFIPLRTDYHEDFLTPGISPLLAISLKHIRHKPKALKYPFFLPHLKQRRTFLVLYFGFLFDFATWAVVAILF